MAVSTGIPPNWKLPLFWAVVDGTKAGNLTESEPALLIGQAFLGGDASVAPKAGMVGNGTLTLDPACPVSASAVPTSAGFSSPYAVKFTSATAFTVSVTFSSPTQVTNNLGNGVVGAPFNNQIAFTIAAGTTAFAAGDEFDVTVNALPLGVAQYNVPIPVSSVAVAQQQFGAGSMLERMVNTFLSGNQTQELWCLPIPRPAAGTKAQGSIAITGQQGGSGVLTIYIGTEKVQITVYQTDTPATVAANLALALNGVNQTFTLNGTLPSRTLPVIAAVDGTNPAKVNLTCRWHGLTGNDIQITPNYLGANGGEALPAGMTLTVVPMSGGTGTPDFTAAISAIQNQQFYNFALPYSDTASLQTWDAEVGFGPTGRWAFTRQQYGWIYNARRDTYLNLLLWGLAQNSPVISTAAIEPTAPSPVWEYVAAYCAQGSAAFLDDAGNSLQTLELAGCLPAPGNQQFSQTQRNVLVNNGLAILGVAPSGNPMILVEQTQYQRNQFVQADTAFALLTTLANLAELLTRFKTGITSKFSRVKLFKDGTKLGPGQNAVTPSIIKGEIVAQAQRAVYDGLMQGMDEFVANLIVEINNNNPNCVNVLWPPQLAGQLRQFNVLAQFRLNYDQNQIAA